MKDETNTIEKQNGIQTFGCCVGKKACPDVDDLECIECVGTFYRASGRSDLGSETDCIGMGSGDNSDSYGARRDLR